MSATINCPECGTLMKQDIIDGVLQCKLTCPKCGKQVTYLLEKRNGNLSGRARPLRENDAG